MPFSDRIQSRTAHVHSCAAPRKGNKPWYPSHSPFAESQPGAQHFPGRLRHSSQATWWRPGPPKDLPHRARQPHRTWAAQRVTHHLPALPLPSRCPCPFQWPLRPPTPPGTPRPRPPQRPPAACSAVTAEDTGADGSPHCWDSAQEPWRQLPIAELRWPPPGARHPRPSELCPRRRSGSAKRNSAHARGSDRGSPPDCSSMVGASLGAQSAISVLQLLPLVGVGLRFVLLLRNLILADSSAQ